MIKFFRNIRRSLLQFGKVRSYVLYSIGEILLVVIGILIALQINNWNQRIQNKKIERTLLISLKEALTLDLENTLGINMILYERRRFITAELIKASETGAIIPDSLTNYYRTMGLRVKFRPVMTAYKVLQSKGLDIIRDKSLKFRLIELYDMEYQLIADRLENDEFNLRDIYRPEIRKYFNFDAPVSPSESLRYSPNNYRTMIKDRDFINTISVMNFNSIGIINILEEQSEKIQDLIKQIDSYLE